MNTRQINYIEPDEDLLEKEVQWAIGLSMEERLITYCNYIISNYAMAGIDARNSR